MDFPEPSARNLTSVQLDIIKKFNDDIRKIFQDILTTKKKEEDYNIKTRGFRRSFEPSYRVPYPSKEDISSTKKDTLAYIMKLKAEETKRPTNVSHNKDVFKPGEKGENKTIRKKKINELEDEDVEVIDRNRLQSFKKQKIENSVGKVPESVSQYSFSSKYTKPMTSITNNKTERDKYKSEGNVQFLHDLKKSRETTKKTLDFLEQEYLNKKEVMKKKKEEELVKQEIDKDKAFVEKILGRDAVPKKSRFEGVSTNNSRYQNAYEEDEEDDEDE